MRCSRGTGRRAATRAAGAVVLACFAGSTCACGPRECPAGAPHPEPVRYPRDAEAYSPGFDLAWLGDEGALRYVSATPERTLVVERSGRVSAGTDFESLRPLGFALDGAVVAEDADRLYVVKDGDLTAVALSGERLPLFHTKAPIDRVKADQNALYVALGRFSEIWRVSKRAKAARLYRVGPHQMLQDFISDGRSLFVSYFDEADVRFRRARVPLSGGSAEVMDCAERMPVLSDAADDYTIEGGWLWRAPRLNGAPTRVVRTTMAPALIDETNAYFVAAGDLLLAAPKVGGKMELLGSFSTGDSADCAVCGVLHDAVCVRCSTEIYRVPKQVRPLGRMIAYHGGSGLAASADYLFWLGDTGLERMERRLMGSDAVYDEQLHQTLLRATAPEFPASRPVLDESDLYFVSKDGKLFRLPVSGGTPVQLFQGRPVPDFTDDARVPRLVALDGGFVYVLDVEDGSVVRIPKSGGPPAVIVTAIVHGRALHVDASTLYVFTAPRTPEGTPANWSGLVGFDKQTGALRFRSDLPGGHVRDVASTKAAVYVSLDNGALYRAPKTDGAAKLVFPTVRQDDFDALPAIRVEALAATDDRLFFTTPTRAVELREGARLPSVLAADLYGRSTDMVADDRGVYFSEAHQFKWKRWTEVGRVEPTP